MKLIDSFSQDPVC